MVCRAATGRLRRCRRCAILFLLAVSALSPPTALVAASPNPGDADEPQSVFRVEIRHGFLDTPQPPPIVDVTKFEDILVSDLPCEVLEVPEAESNEAFEIVYDWIPDQPVPTALVAYHWTGLDFFDCDDPQECGDWMPEPYYYDLVRYYASSGRAESLWGQAEPTGDRREIGLLPRDAIPVSMRFFPAPADSTPVFAEFLKHRGNDQQFSSYEPVACFPVNLDGRIAISAPRPERAPLMADPPLSWVIEPGFFLDPDGNPVVASGGPGTVRPLEIYRWRAVDHTFQRVFPVAGESCPSQYRAGQSKGSGNDNDALLLDTSAILGVPLVPWNARPPSLPEEMFDLGDAPERIRVVRNGADLSPRPAPGSYRPLESAGIEHFGVRVAMPSPYEPGLIYDGACAVTPFGSMPCVLEQGTARAFGMAFSFEAARLPAEVESRNDLEAILKLLPAQRAMELGGALKASSARRIGRHPGTYYVIDRPGHGRRDRVAVQEFLIGRLWIRLTVDEGDCSGWKQRDIRERFLRSLTLVDVN